MADDKLTTLRSVWDTLKKAVDTSEPSEHLGSGYAYEGAEKIKKRKRKQQEEMDEMDK
jgi:hypothetical protein